MRTPAPDTKKIMRLLFSLSFITVVFVILLMIRVLDASDQRLHADIPVAAENPPPETVEVEIPGGLNVGEIAQILSDSQIGGHQRDLLTLVGLLGSGRSIRSGSYTFDGSGSSGMAIAHLLKGPDSDYILDFQPGLRNEEIRETLVTVSQFTLTEWESAVTTLLDSRKTSLLLDPQLLIPEDIGPSSSTSKLQGYLHPGAYMITSDTSLFDLLAAMFDNLSRLITEQMLSDAAKNGYTIREVIILASIIEREVTKEAELPLVASVFLNRLDNSMPLQSDATVQFALAEDKNSVDLHGWWKQAVQQEDLRTESRYNTFQAEGLPPTPISNPSLSAIMAVIYPAQTDYLFFLVSPKCDGTHNFADTYEEHLENMVLFNSSECAASIQ
ncbi:MAG: hypothetical protein CL771_06885 [Chloroflexi bacterium]|nr:hypothetical protein [Chloroflexota bacterium]|tara:strand:- start:13226 stop:14380 length:1155 start_codon:yes stop_codon:yes gene_type:complete